MATRRKDTNPGHARSGEDAASSVPAAPDSGRNSASELIEAPQPPTRGTLERCTVLRAGCLAKATIMSRGSGLFP